MWHMPDRLIGATSRPLAKGWRLCALATQSVAQPSDLPVDTAWSECPDALPVAEAVRTGLVAPPADGLDSVDWWYQLTLPSDALAAGLDPGADWQLHAPGLATLAEVWLGDERLLAQANQFVPVNLALGSAARWSGQTLTLVFRSLDQALLAKRPRPMWKAPMVRHQQLRWWRTSLFGRSPSWTPPCPLIGPTGRVSLVQAGPLDCQALQWHTDWQEGVGRLDLQLEVTCPGGLLGAELVLSQVGHVGHEQCFALTLHTQESGRIQVLAELVLPGAAAWWPHTHGEPCLYAAQIRWQMDGASGVVVQDLGRIGFRGVHLGTQAGDFHLHINGRGLFARGVNLLPPAPTLADLDVSGWRQALQPYVDAGMNMLRIPGNMTYGSESFYRCCDELGLMVWQDFMFSNMDYPADDLGFQAEVQAEIACQVPRLEAHPSLVVWCGNSEVSQQALMYAAPRERWAPALFHEWMPAWLKAAGSRLPYWPSSVHGGSFPCRADEGTTSYYGVGVYRRPMEDARRSGLRFATECLGLANEPMSLRQGGWEPRDAAIGGDFVAVRDHYLHALFKLDPVALAEREPERYQALSRVTSAQVMAAAFEEWRRDTSACHGALIWFGRDVQPGAGFGILDHEGLPKTPFHALRRVLRSRALSFSDEGGNGLFLHAINETGQAAQGRVDLTLYRADGSRVDAGSLPLDVPAWSSRCLPVGDAFDWFLDLSWAYRFGPPVAHVVSARWVAWDGACLAEHVDLPAGWDLPPQDDLGWALTLMSHSHSDTGLETVQVQVQTDRFAQAVLVDAPGWVAEDQCFHLLPGQPRVLCLCARRAGAARDIAMRGINSATGITLTLDRPAPGVKA
jgi:beta-mannosidase